MAVSRKSAKQLVMLVGGPWNKHKLMLQTFVGSLTFKVREYHGYYDWRGCWYDVGSAKGEFLDQTREYVRGYN